MTKDEALWLVLDAARETKRASDSGLLDLSEQKREWRESVETALAAGATEREIATAEKEGQS